MRLYIYKVEDYSENKYMILVIAKNRNQSDRIALRARNTIYDWVQFSFVRSIRVDPKTNKVGLLQIYGQAK